MLERIPDVPHTLGPITQSVPDIGLPGVPAAASLRAATPRFDHA